MRVWLHHEQPSHQLQPLHHDPHPPKPRQLALSPWAAQGLEGVWGPAAAGGGRVAGCCRGTGCWSCPSMLATEGLGLLRLLCGSCLGATCLRHAVTLASQCSRPAAWGWVRCRRKPCRARQRGAVRVKQGERCTGPWVQCRFCMVQYSGVSPLPLGWPCRRRLSAQQ